VVGGVVGWVREGWVDWWMGGRRERARGVYGLFSLISTICIIPMTVRWECGFMKLMK
jgi:hypothetical protein